jgi:serine/threonine-protein kinase
MARVGKYELSGELGRGGMAIVYRAIDPVIRRPVAVKVVRKADLDPGEAQPILERFKREAQAAGALHHPNVVAIYEYGEDAELAWIAMELVEGKSLHEHLRAGYRPSLERLPEVLEQMLVALDYSHARGVVHRDVKPGNVLVSEMGVAKISDFGIARIERSHVTQAGEVLGTPYYMAPEQFNGQPADERTDVYGAAVIVYEVLCGRKPFEGQGGNLMKHILQDEPPAPSAVEPRLPAAVDTVLARALAKNPAGRYSSASDLLEALREAFAAAPSGVAAPRASSGRAATTSSPQSAPRLAGGVSALRRGLEAAGAKTAAPAPASAGAPAPRRPAVLFVDDEERVLKALEFLFRDGYEVETATSGALALARLKARRFHVLVSDQRMPEMPGVELLRQARALAPTTVRILLTGYSDLAAIVGSVNESEVFRFVSKPWQQEDLQATLAEAVSVAIAVEAAAARGAPALKSDAGVLIFGEPAIARGARELARGAFRVHEAADLEQALAALAAEEIGAMVCDVDGRAEDPAALLRVLKSQSPQTQLIAASAASDSELIISLINEARIYRFLKKPVNLSLLGAALRAALERYSRMVRTPGLARTESPKAAKETPAARSILARLKALGGRFAATLK